MKTALLITEGNFHKLNGKTAHGLLRMGTEYDIVGVLDSTLVGKDVKSQLPAAKINPLFYKDIEDYLSSHETPDYLIVGVAFSGGALPENIRDILKLGLSKGMNIISGAHVMLSEDPEFAQLALENSAVIKDVRKPKPKNENHFWSGKILEKKTPIIAVLGIDCAVGKRTTTTFLLEYLRSTGLNCEMIYTGQTGSLQGHEFGFIFDSTLNDFVSGEMEHAILECIDKKNPDLVLLEGQSALQNPSGPCGSEFILSGNAKGVILQHAPFRKYFDGFEEQKIELPTLEKEIQLIELYGAKVLGVCLNTLEGSLEEAKAIQKELQEKLDIPVVLPLEGEYTLLGPSIEEYMKTAR